MRAYLIQRERLQMPEVLKVIDDLRSYSLPLLIDDCDISYWDGALLPSTANVSIINSRMTGVPEPFSASWGMSDG